MTSPLRPAITLLVLMTLITGIAYPLVVTAVAQVAFPSQAGGSLVRDTSGQVRGSSLIAQGFDGPSWFHSRPSAGAFATVASSASNYGPGNPALAERIGKDSATEQLTGQDAVPMALVTTSGSGLDPHLPPAAVDYQVARVASARQLPPETVRGLVTAHIETSLIGPPVVNVLALNMALDALPKSR